MSKILAIDLDGTLFWPKQKKHYVPKKNVEFLRKFIDEGNKVVLVSSRTVDFMKNVIKEIDRDIDYISMLGSVISINGVTVRDETLDPTTVKELIESINKEFKPKGYANTTRNYPVLVSNGPSKLPQRLVKLYLRWYNTFGIYKEPITLSDTLIYEENEKKNVYSLKIFFGLGPRKNRINKELNKEVREHYPHVECSWLGLAIEITSKGCSKAESLKYYTDYIKANHDDVYVVGDSGNDITMFNAYYEHSFVMSHSYPSVKKYAKYRIRRVYKLADYLLNKEEK